MGGRVTVVSRNDVGDSMDRMSPFSVCILQHVAGVRKTIPGLLPEYWRPVALVCLVNRQKLGEAKRL